MGKWLIVVALALVSVIAYQTVQNRRAAAEFAQWKATQEASLAQEERKRLAREAAFQQKLAMQKQKQRELNRKMRELRTMESRKRLMKIEEHADDKEFLDYLDHKDEIAAEKSREDARQKAQRELNERVGIAVGAILKSAKEMQALGIGETAQFSGDMTESQLAPVNQSRPNASQEAAQDPEAIRAAEAFASKFGSKSAAQF